MAANGKSKPRRRRCRAHREKPSPNAFTRLTKCKFRETKQEKTEETRARNKKRRVIRDLWAANSLRFLTFCRWRLADDRVAFPSAPNRDGSVVRGGGAESGRAGRGTLLPQ